LAEESYGALDVQVFAGGVLGSEPEMFEGIQQGTIDAIVTSPGNLSSFVPPYQILDLPFVFRDDDHRAAVADGRVGAELTRLLEERAGIIVLGNFGGSERNLISRDRPITSLADMQGLKMRVWEAPAIIESWAALGTSPTVIAYAEVYTALQTGVVDAAENEPPTFVTQKWYEPTNYITLSRHSYTVRPFIMGADAFRSLSDEHQELLLRLGREAAEYEVELEREFGEEAMRTMQEQYGIEVLELTDRDEWIERTEPVRQKIAADLDVSDLLEQIEAAGT
jgi:TRAP-type transport system periplasmic protein